MQAKLLALRAVGARYARSVIYPLFGYLAFGGGLLILVIGLLAHYFSDWWWLAVIPVGVLILIGLIVWLVVRFIIKIVSPPLTKTQATATDEFIAKLSRLYENASTPYPFLMARIVFEVTTRRKDSLITQTISDSRSLKKDFERLERFF